MLLDKFPHNTIVGCQNVPLLTRWKIFETSFGSLYVHQFHRSDEDLDLHDHPFSFISVILKNGYTEVRPVQHIRKEVLNGSHTGPIEENIQERKSYFPGAILFRPARWAHRVELHAVDAPSWSLVFRSKKIREWGFFSPYGWEFWKDWHRAKICEED